MKITIKTCWSTVISLLVMTFWMAEAMATPITPGDLGSSIYGTERILDSFFGTETSGVDIDNPNGAIVYDFSSPSTYTEISGYADPGVNEINTFDSGAYAYAHNDHKSVIESRFGNSFTVEAGDSGLSAGEATTITLNFRMDGFTSVGGNRYSAYESIVNITSGFSLWNPEIETEDSDGYPYSPSFMDFDAYIYHEESSEDGNAVTDGSLDWRWSVDSWNVDADDYVRLFNDSGYSTFGLADNETASCTGVTTPSSCNTESFDTGLLSIDIETYIGAEFFYYSWLKIIDDANGDGYGYGDFLNTLGGEAVPENGVQLSFALAPTVRSASVPEPSTIFLLGFGLVVMVGLGKSFKT